MSELAISAQQRAHDREQRGEHGPLPEWPRGARRKMEEKTVGGCEANSPVRRPFCSAASDLDDARRCMTDGHARP